MLAKLRRDGVLTMEDMENINDIPDGVARIEALDQAMKTCVEGENPSDVLARANLYYAFLTANRNSVRVGSATH